MNAVFLAFWCLKNILLFKKRYYNDAVLSSLFLGNIMYEFPLGVIIVLRTFAIQ